MEGGFPCGWVLLSLVLLFVGWVTWAVISTKRDNEREHRAIVRQAAARQAAREQEEELWTIADAWRDIALSFPFLPQPQPKSDSTEDIMHACARVLLDVPSLGYFTRSLLPAPALPSEERRKHLYVVGKTGSGKTTYLEHLILADLKAGRGVGVMAPEGELFRARLLSLMPSSRRGDVIYFAPGDPACPLTFNPLAVEPGDDAIRAAEDLFTIFRRALGDEGLGPRMLPILQNAFAVLVGRPGATLWDVKRLLTDSAFRQRVVSSTPDPYIREFWETTFPRFAKGADLPLLSRLDHFLRPPVIRRALCNPVSSFSIRKALGERKVLLFDLFGLSEETRALLGQILLSKFQIELMRRELSLSSPEPFSLYCDEFQTFAGFAPGVWRELLSRGRKYGLALTLAHQFPAQLPTSLQEEIFGNVGSMVAFGLGNKDAQVMRRELLIEVEHKAEVKVEPLPVEDLIELSVGEAYAKLAGGRAVKLYMPSPLPVTDASRALAVVTDSWMRYGVQPEPQAAPEPEQPTPEPTVTPEPEAARVVTEEPKAEQPREAEPEVPFAPIELPPSSHFQPEAAAAYAAKTAEPGSPSRQGKGGPEHTYLQELIKRWAGEWGFRVAVEEQIEGSRESVDVALYRGALRIACEISVTTPLEYEVGNVKKCLAAGFGTVAVVSGKRGRLTKLGKLLSERLSPEEVARVQLVTPEELLAWLSQQPAEVAEGVVGGYKVKVRYGQAPEARSKRVAEILAKSLSRLEKG